MYLSKTIQNELINLCGKNIIQTIVSDVKKQEFFSIMADEVRDCSNSEQLALVVRYVDETCTIREEFIEYIECDTGTTGLALGEKIISKLEELGLDIKDIRGQCYDGAGNMASPKVGVHKRILELNELAIYFHCFSHQLNLVIVASCGIQRVRNVMSIVKAVSYFFNLSPKRHGCLKSNKEAYVEKLKKEAEEAGKAKTDKLGAKVKLIDVCMTRWMARIEGMGVFETLFPVIVHTLEKMKDNTDPNEKFNNNTCSQAISLFKSCHNFEFVATLVITRKLLSYTSAATEMLQNQSNDILCAFQLIQSIQGQFSDIRNNIDDFHDEIFKTAVDIAAEVFIEPSVPRTCSQQAHRDNHPYETISDYYKNSVTIPMVDHVELHLRSRFTEKSLKVVKGFYLVPFILCKANAEQVNWREHVWEFFEFYSSDFPITKDIDAELDLWERYWRETSENLPENIADTLSVLYKINVKSYPNIYKTLKIMAVIPSTSYSCERSISSLRRLKDYTQSTMKNERLNGLAAMFIHRDIEIDPKSILKAFCHGDKNRRANFGIIS